MSKALVNKVRLILVLALVMVVSVCAGMFAFAKADVTISSVDEVTTFQLNETGIFYHEEDDKVGLNFTASISVAEYEALQTLDGLGYGIVIAPDYYPDLNQANLFDDGAIFGWATYENNEWLAYEGEGYQVINIYTNDWKLGDGVYTYSGAIVDILSQNIGAEFKAVAYITADGLYNITDAIVTSTTIEYAKCGAEVPSYVPAEWAFEPEVLDLGIVTPADMGNEIDLSEAPSSREWKLVDNNGNEYTEGVIDLTLAENQRQWTAIESINGVTLSVMTFDVVDENGLFVWNDEISMDSVNAIAYQGDEKVKQSYYDLGKGEPTEETIDDVDYVSFTASGDNGTWFAWKPLHSKEYYEAWAGKGVSLSATMIIDASAMVDTTGKVVDQAGFFGESVGNSYKTTQTLTYTATLDKILANWDAIVGCNWDGVWDNRFLNGMAYVYNVHNGGKVSVGDFKVNVPSDAYANKGGDILVNVEEVADLTALDLTSYMEESHAAKLEAIANAYDLSYSLKGYSIADEIEVTDLTKVDVSNATRAAYDLVVSSGENIFYTARIDLYNTTDAVVWADELTEYNVVARKLNYQVGWPSASTGMAEYEGVDTITENSKTGSFIKFTVTEAMNIALDIKALHTKAYYNEMIGDSNKVFFIKGYFSSSISLGFNGGAVNYGIHNAFSTWRQGTQSTYESIVISLDNYLIANNANDSITGKWYNWNNIESSNAGQGNTMLQFEIPSATAETPYVFYIGIESGKSTIVEGGETLATEAQVKDKVIDLSTATTYDLVDLLPELSKAKFRATAQAWVGKTIRCCSGRVHEGNGLAFVLTINGQKHTVVPNANGEAILNLDDPVVSDTGTVSTTKLVRDLLSAGNNSVSIIGYALPATFPGHSTQFLPSATITIVGPNA